MSWRRQSARPRVLAVLALLVAAQLALVGHAAGHVLGDGDGVCILCHAADGGSHGALAAGCPPPPRRSGTAVPVVAHAPSPTDPQHDFQARAPPAPSR